MQISVYVLSFIYRECIVSFMQVTAIPHAFYLDFISSIKLADKAGKILKCIFQSYYVFHARVAVLCCRSAFCVKFLITLYVLNASKYTYNTSISRLKTVAEDQLFG